MKNLVIVPLRHRPTRSVRHVIVAAFVCCAAAIPARAEHRARLSADLSEHLASGSPSIDVIVHGDKVTVDALAKRYNVEVKRYLRSGAVLHLNAGQLAAMQQDETIDHLSGDTRIRSIADVTAESIGADQVWAGVGALPALSGAGVTVAVIDTGMDLQHNALRGRVVVTEDFIGGDGVDHFGHGTHVAGIIAGVGGQTADTATYRGIASGAYLANLRALGDDGSGAVSDVIEAIDWAIDHRHQFNIRVINLSLGTPVLQPYRDDPLCEAVARAVTAGIVVVAAAGNHGLSADGKTVLGSITSPGNSPHALTIGALDTHGTATRSDDSIASFSSRGPTMYDLVIKPDVVAPGTHVISAEAADSYLARTYPAHHTAGSGPNAYMELSGTSMAAGVVSGAVALLLEETPGLKPVGTKAAVQATATFLPAEGLVGAGAGSVNVFAAAELIMNWHGFEPNVTVILNGGEAAGRDGIVTVANGNRVALSQNRSLGQSLGAQTIIWGQNGGDTIIWGQSTGDTIIWGQSAGDTIIWGQNSGDTIIWGQSTGDTIIWGQSTGDTIIWGQSAGDTIIWGQSTADTIIWGQASADTIIWGQSADTIIWGQDTL